MTLSVGLRFDCSASEESAIEYLRFALRLRRRRRGDELRSEQLASHQSGRHTLFRGAVTASPGLKELQ